MVGRSNHDPGNHLLPFPDVTLSFFDCWVIDIQRLRDMNGVRGHFDYRNHVCPVVRQANPLPVEFQILYSNRVKQIFLERSKVLPPIEVEGTWDPIIDVETFDQVQSLLSSRRFIKEHPRRVSSRYLLSGLLKCAHCKQSYSGRKAKSGRYDYYVCGRVLQSGAGSCKGSYVRVDRLEESVVEAIRDQILEPEAMKTLARMIDEELKSDRNRVCERLEAVERELSEIEGRLGRLYDALETGLLSIDALAPRINPAREGQESLLQKRSQIALDGSSSRDLSSDFNLTPEDLDDLRRILDEGSPAERRGFVRSFVREVEVGDSTATVTYTVPTITGNTAFYLLSRLVELGGLEPPTSALRTPRSPR